MKHSLLALSLLALFGLAAYWQKPSVTRAVNDPESASMATPIIAPIAAAGEADSNPGTFQFGDDGAGRLLAKTLTPAAPPRLPAAGTAVPHSRAVHAAFLAPEVPLRPVAAVMPRPAPRLRATPAPQMLVARFALDYLHEDPVLPPRPESPMGPLIRQAAPDAQRATPLAIQAKPVPDRVSLEDPTGEFSREKCLASPAPLRTQPVPLLRMNLPEPFEFRSTVRPPMGEVPPVAPVPQLPK